MSEQLDARGGCLGREACWGHPEESAELHELRKHNRLLEQENEVLRRAAAYLARDINPQLSTRWSSISLPRTRLCGCRWR